MNVDINRDIQIDNVDDNNLIIAIDSTGIKVTNRGQWMYDKWGDGTKTRKGYLKIHVVAVDIKTKEILALEVTDDEKVHDSRMMKELVKHVLKINPHKIKIRSVLADDGANDTNKNFRYLEKNRIVPAIKVIRSNSIVSSKNNNLRNKEVKMQ